MKTNSPQKRLFLKYFRANLPPVHRASLALMLCLFGFLLPAQGQDPRLTNTNNPMDTNVSVGATVTFRLSAGSTNLPLTYQWQHEGTNLPSATNWSLVITYVTVAHAGGYMAWITNSIGNYTNTRTAILTVDPTFVRINDGPGETDTEGSIGAAWGDYDGDGYPDLFIANLTLGRTAKNTLWHNDGDGTFTKLTTNSPALATGYWWYAYWIDYDNDGDLDLHVLAAVSDQDRFYRNDGNGVFTPVTPEFVKSTSLGGLCSWSDFDNDGWLDVFIPRNGGKDLFFRGAPGGSFRSMTTNDVGSVVQGSSFSVGATFDYDNDGWQDLLVAPLDYNGSTSGLKSRLHHNEGDGFFRQITEGALASQINTFPGGLGQAASYAAGDYDNDGDFDLMVTGGEDGYRARLYRNDGDGIFTNVAAAAGVNRPLNAGGSVWADYDNDGDLDLLIVCLLAWNPPQRYGNESVLFQNNGDGTFTSVEIGSPLHDGVWKVAYTWVDYDHDGFLDLFLSSGNGDVEPNYLYRNNLPATGNTNHWLKVRLAGKASNSMGVGAKVRVTATIGGKTVTQVRQITVPGSFTQEDYLAHFGLGDATKVDTLRIEWPSGNVQELTDVVPERLLTLTELMFIAPTRPSASLNGSVTLTRTAVAGATYQWQFNGVDLAGQTNRTLNLTNIVADQEGRYSVVASNATTITTNFTYVNVDKQFEQITTGDIVNTRSDSYLPAWGDYDGDGYPDLFVANGGNEGPTTQFLYHNNGDGTFHRTTEADVGRLAGDKVQSAMGVWGDFNNDGNLDLFIGSWISTNRLYQNLGNGTFAPVTTPGGISLATWGSAWGDYDQDGWLDLCTSPNGNRDRIYHNERNGSFSWLRKFMPPTTSGLFPSWGDADGDGDLDLYVGNQDGGLYYRSDGEDVFTRMTGTNSVTGGGWYGTWGDYDNDGSLDLYAQTGLFHNNGSGRFTRVVGGPSGGQVSAWADYDNDGYLDLFFTQGQGGADRNVLYHNNGDRTFTKVTLGSVVNVAANYTGCAWGDYDNDGCMDLFVSTIANQPNYLFHGRPNGNHWLTVKLRGTASNTSAIGATVRAFGSLAGRATWQMRQITGMADDLRAHFGLGITTNIMKLRIEWPSGAVQEFANIAADQLLNVWEPPAISAALREDGACELRITAEPNRGWQVQASGDLLTWQTLTTLTSTTSTLYFIDTAAAGMDCRFYRVESK